LNALRIGTRGSKLALWQARHIAAALGEKAGVETEIVIVRTTGDIDQTSFARIGAKGVFIKELEDALLEARIDVAVHSMKDVPTELPAGLTIAAIARREDVRDAVVSSDRASLQSLPRGARVGTSSLRRQSQLLHARPDLRVRELRGNVDTRLEKLRRGDYEAIVLAKAGLDRLGLTANISEILSCEVSMPAAGQGAIGIEARSEDEHTLRRVAILEDAETRSGVAAERAALAGLGGGCQVPIGAWGRFENDELALDVVVLSPDGVRRIADKVAGPRSEAEAIGGLAARNLKERGAAALLEAETRRTGA